MANNQGIMGLLVPAYIDIVDIDIIEMHVISYKER